MKIFLLLLYFICVAIIFFVALKDTVFEFSLRKKRFGGVPILREIFIFVFIGVALYEVMGINKFNTFYITNRSISETSPVIIFSIVSLFVSIGFFSRTIFKKYLVFNRISTIDNKFSEVNGTYILKSTALLLIFLILSVSFFGGKHAFIASIFDGASLLQVRLANTYESTGPAFLRGYMRISTTLLAVLLGYFGNKVSKSRQYIYMFLIIYSTTFTGDKSPLIGALLIFYISRLSVTNYHIKKLLLIAAAVFLITLTLIYTLTKIQFPEMIFDDIIIYVFERLGVGQIQGVYEQFALRLQDFSYIINEIPLSGIFLSKDPFSKDLMMLTGAYGMSRQDIGVMNSLFIGEALAIGGTSLVYASPIIVAFNYCLLTFLVIKIMIKKFKISLFDSRKVGVLFAASITPFTGDFGGLLMFKKVIAVVVFMTLLFLVSKLRKFSFRRTVSLNLPLIKKLYTSPQALVSAYTSSKQN